MPSDKRVFTLRLFDEDYAKMQHIAKQENRSMANAIEYMVKKRIEEYEASHGEIEVEEED